MTNDVDQARPAMAAPATGRRPALTREQVLTAAVAIIDAEGVEALTMRRLGQALDRDPMAIYRHAADKDALLDGVVEHVAAELITSRESDSIEDGDWEAVLHRTAHTFRRDLGWAVGQARAFGRGRRCREEAGSGWSPLPAP